MLYVLSVVSAVHLPYFYIVLVVAPVSEAKLGVQHHIATILLHAILLLKLPRSLNSVKYASSAPDAHRNEVESVEQVRAAERSALDALAG